MVHNTCSEISSPYLQWLLVFSPSVYRICLYSKSICSALTPSIIQQRQTCRSNEEHNRNWNDDSHLSNWSTICAHAETIHGSTTKTINAWEHFGRCVRLAYGVIISSFRWTILGLGIRELKRCKAGVSPTICSVSSRTCPVEMKQRLNWQTQHTASTQKWLASIQQFDARATNPCTPGPVTSATPSYSSEFSRITEQIPMPHTRGARISWHARARQW